MSNDLDLSEQYVAEMLKNDAKASSIKYSTIGLQAFLPQRSFGTAPKPNTRFLKNIIRETDTHNAALLAKEQREARLKQASLSRHEQKRSTSADSRKRKSRHSRHEEEPARKKRYDGVDEEQDRRDRVRAGEEGRYWRPAKDSGRSPSRSPRRRSRSPYRTIDEYHPSRDGNRNDRRRDLDEDRDGQRVHRHTSHDGRRSRAQRSESRDAHPQQSSRSHRRHERHRSRHRRSGSTSSSSLPRRSREREYRSHRSSENGATPLASQFGVPSTNPKKPSSRGWTHMSDRSPNKGSHVPIEKKSFVHGTSSASESDPLEALIGPAPPPPEPSVRTRGRGAFNHKSAAMDAHFGSQYDPSIDVQPDPETEDDWDQALEAMRDRQKWKQQGAERLLSAGFSETMVKKWEKGGEKDETDVRWAKKGEGREWDRGKVVDGEGVIEIKAEWGRLT